MLLKKDLLQNYEVEAKELSRCQYIDDYGRKCNRRLRSGWKYCWKHRYSGQDASNKGYHALIEATNKFRNYHKQRMIFIFFPLLFGFLILTFIIVFTVPNVILLLLMLLVTLIVPWFVARRFLKVKFPLQVENEINNRSPDYVDFVKNEVQIKKGNWEFIKSIFNEDSTPPAITTKRPHIFIGKKNNILVILVSIFIIILLIGVSWIFLFTNLDGVSAIDVRELSENPNKYLGKVITVKGNFRQTDTHYVIASSTLQVNYPIFLEIPSSVNTNILFVFEEYYFTGIATYGVFTAFGENGARYGDNLYMKIQNIEPTYQGSSYCSVSEMVYHPASYINRTVTVKAHVNEGLDSIGDNMGIKADIPANYPTLLIPGDAEYNLKGTLVYEPPGILSVHDTSLKEYMKFIVKNDGQGNEIYATPINDVLNYPNDYLNKTITINAQCSGGGSSYGTILLGGEPFYYYDFVDNQNSEISAIFFDDINLSILNTYMFRLNWFLVTGKVIRDINLFNGRLLLIASAISTEVNGQIIESKSIIEHNLTVSYNQTNQQENETIPEYVEGTVISVRDLVTNPMRYNGKNVKIKAIVRQIIGDFTQISIADNETGSSFLFAYPDNIDRDYFIPLTANEYYWYGMITVIQEAPDMWGISFNVSKVEMI